MYTIQTKQIHKPAFLNDNSVPLLKNAKLSSLTEARYMAQTTGASSQAQRVSVFQYREPSHDSKQCPVRGSRLGGSATR